MLADVLHDLNPWWRDPAAGRLVREPFRRAFERRIEETLVRTDRRALLLVGPRQVGKSTALRQARAGLLEAGWPAGNVTYFDFSDDRVVRESPTPRAVAEVRPVSFDSAHPQALLLDEIGSAPAWAEWIKQAVDAGQGTRIVATDSAATLLRASGRESGLGRWDELEVEGLTYGEFLGIQALPGETVATVERRLPGAFERYLARGGFPEHVFAEDVSEVRQRLRTDIVDRAILRDLLRSGLDLERVRVLFLYLVEASGGIIDAPKLQRDLSADRRSLEKWLAQLEETLLVRRLEPLEQSHGKRLRARLKPRLYATDHGLVTAFASVSSPLSEPHRRAQALEALVFRHLRGVAEQVWYWREGDDLELDFVARVNGRLVAIEVTTSADVPVQKIGRCRLAAERIGAAKTMVVHGGFEESEREGVSLLPARRFALDPAAALGVHP